VLQLAPRLAARPIVRLERRLAAPFAPIGHVENRPAALATAALLAIVGVTASLIAAFHLGDLLGLSSLGRTVTIAVVIGWVLLNDAVEPLGLRLRSLVASLAGELDTYRPVAAAWVSMARAGALLLVIAAAVAASFVDVTLAATIALFAVGLTSSQAESVARRRAWALGDGTPAGRSNRSSGRDEELVHAITNGAPSERDAIER
jgi:hypothetical protein